MALRAQPQRHSIAPNDKPAAGRRIWRHFARSNGKNRKFCAKKREMAEFFTGDGA
jgi:hypothetical protein